MAEAAHTKTFQFELVSPEKILTSEQVSMVVVPGEAGDFGVLADHAPLLSSLRAGIVTITPENGETRQVFVAGGFADVTPEQCSVLAEEAVNVQDMSMDDLENSRKDIQEQMVVDATDELKVARLQKELAVVEAKIEAVKTAA